MKYFILLLVFFIPCIHADQLDEEIYKYVLSPCFNKVNNRLINSEDFGNMIKQYANELVELESRMNFYTKAKNQCIKDLKRSEVNE